MKKLYLLLLTLLLLFIPATQAVEFYQLDQPIIELNGYTLREVFQNRNMAMPNLNNATDLGDGVYRVYQGVNRYYDYDINTGNNYVSTSTSGGGSAYVFNVPIGTYTITVESNNIEQTFYLRTNLGDFYFNQITGGVKHVYTYENVSSISILFYQIVDFTTEFKLQIEKGDTATPYQVPTNGPYSDIDLGQFGLTSGQIQTYYNLYLEAVRLEHVHDPQSVMSLEFFMISTFFMYILIMGVGYFAKNKYLYFAGAILWFVPIFNYQNIFIITTSVIVFISHLLIIFYSDKDDVFE